MTISAKRPKVFGTGLIALDVVMGMNPQAPIRAWAGGTCGNVLSILAYLGWNSFPIARMNGDPASERVMIDMARWGVRLDYARCAPTSHTPIVVQEIQRGRDGEPKHRFSWSCPRCGQWLPGFKPITRAAVEVVEGSLAGGAVFFLDRLSRATLTLAARASAEGAVVMFEVAAKADEKLLAEAIQIAHVVKYADQRLAADRVTHAGTATLVEVQTLGAHGLRYRHRFGERFSDWMHLNAIRAARLADSCGSGDWCSAGLLAKACFGGQAGLRAAGAKGIRNALRYGQALAAWNCGFEGARGGMYAVSQGVFRRQIEAFIAGHPESTALEHRTEKTETAVVCPACPSEYPLVGGAKGATRRHV